MADDTHHNASCEKTHDSGQVLETVPSKRIMPIKLRKLSAQLSSYVSAQDLRCLDLEKEKNDLSSPRGVLEACIKNYDSDANLVNDKTDESENKCSNSKPRSLWGKFFKLWRKKSVKRLPSLASHAVPKISRRMCRSTREHPVPNDISNFNSSFNNFSLSSLQTATNNFSSENIIGKGGYAEVFRGCLKDGQLVAIKRLTKGTPDEITSGFLSELGIIAHVNHRNIAKLIGCCIEGGMHLVFHLSKLGSLGSLLHGSSCKLDWSQRYKIALGTADGLRYLHESCHRRIIHRDIKADNILLAEDYEPQICDFGLAKWLPRHWTHHNVSKFEGTFGYFAPEYFMHGIVDEKTDVFAFGVLLLEIITGRRAIDDSQQSIVLWAKPLLDQSDIHPLVDPALGDDYDKEEMGRVVLTAYMCIEQSPVLRPRMNQIVVLLRGDEYALKNQKESRRRTLRRAYSEELLDAHDYNSTKYLRDLNRHKQVALDS